METSEQTDPHLISLAKRLLRQQKFLDPQIGTSKYKKNHLKDYIQFCCDNKYYIEAYSLAVQYIEDLILTFIKPGSNSLNATHVGIIIQVLSTCELIPTEVHSRYISAKETRNMLAHKIINSPDKIELLGKQGSDSHAKNLLSLITSMEDVYITFFTKFKKRVVGKDATQIVERLSDILVDRTYSAIKEKADKYPNWDDLEDAKKHELFRTWSFEANEKILKEFNEKNK